jgi:hypothetical protein
MSAVAFAVDSDCIGNRVEIADESTCLMTVQSAAGIPDAPDAAEMAADAAELAAEMAEDTAADALAAGALGELLELPELLQAASTAQVPPATITASARRGSRG